ncbi:hypothetical protein [Burkholderia sp. Bp8991]|uniref:hypothetical protein n=1 Tax=Burkholderia sp. Bp8991 TaxID=2184553 RepID=UPI000F59F71A|nr:hypothetical protein [Burkholderia sp. Bp8991]RQS01068.1 hypothetical protein DIE02_26270 [Burkholderia sp. Bp8991]
MNHSEEYEARLRALGDVVTAHAHGEALIHAAFMDYSGIDADRLRIIQEHGQVKIGHMPRIIKAFIEHFPSDDPDADESVRNSLTEFDKLTQQRNKFVHWQWGTGAEGLPSISNFVKQRVGGEFATQSFSLEELRTLADRLRNVTAVLAINLPSSRASIPKDIRDAFAGFAKSTK